MRCLYLNILDELVAIQTTWSEVYEVLHKDFYSFAKPLPQNNRQTTSITVHRSKNPLAMPKTVASMQTQNAITYDSGDIRYCDYYGRAYTIVDFKKNEAHIYGEDFEIIHEISYLLTLSLVGKALDLKGLHKLHAFAVSFNQWAFVCMMPSKGGKSTLLVELLRDPRFKMISDDIPFFNKWGQMLSFPMKIGINELPSSWDFLNPSENIYTMKRSLYGQKTLLCTRGIEGKVEKPGKKFSKIVLAEAFRYNATESEILPSSWGQSFSGLFKHGIIGLGSPMVIEYFWRNGWRDFFLKTLIFFRRSLAFMALSFRAKKIKIHSSYHPNKTAKDIIDYLEKLTNESSKDPCLNGHPSEV